MSSKWWLLLLLMFLRPETSKATTTPRTTSKLAGAIANNVSTISTLRDSTTKPPTASTIPDAITTNVSTISTLRDSTTKPPTASKSPGLIATSPSTISTPPDSTARSTAGTVAPSTVDTTAATTTTTTSTSTTTTTTTTTFKPVPVCDPVELIRLVSKINTDFGEEAKPCYKAFLSVDAWYAALNMGCDCMRFVSKSQASKMKCGFVKGNKITVYDIWEMCQKEHKPRWLVHGCPLATKPLQSVVADPNQPMSPVVRCCDYAGVCKLKYSDTGYCFIRNRTGRPSLFNYHAAATVCANDRKRLCTKEELFSVKATGCCKQGCDNPHELIWTSSVPEAPNATTAGRNITANTTMRQSPTAAGAIVDDGDGKDASVTIVIGVVVAVAILGAVIGGGVAVACALADQRGTLPESIEGKVVVPISDSEEPINLPSPYGERRASVTDVTHRRQCSHSDLRAAADMYRMTDSLLLENLETQELETRTFKTSNFKAVYDSARVPEDCVEILTAVKMIIRLYAESRGIDEQSWQHFYKKLYDQAWTQAKVLQGDVAAAAEYIWTSNKSLNLLEFCSMLNATIRGDVADEMVHVAMFARAINTRRVQRDPEAIADMKYPHDGKLWRGTGFDNKFKDFFVARRKYRVPGLLATSLNKRTSEWFLSRIDNGVQPALWCILVDPAGKKNFACRNKNASYVAKSHLKGEGEYLFTAYSVFTCKEVEWSDNPQNPHHITVEAAHDNAFESNDLPLAPWY